MLFGTTRQSGEVLVGTPCYRLQGLAVLDRLPGTAAEARSADFKVIVHGASPEQVRWSAHLVLPAGQQSVAMPFVADALGHELQLWVTRPEGEAGGLLAGYRELEITNAVEAKGPPQLWNDRLPVIEVTPELVQSLLGAVAWRPQQLVVRAGQPTAAGLALGPGGEVWLHTEAMLGEITGQLRAQPSAGGPAWVRVLWYKGGRLQILQQSWLQPGQAMDFRAWTAEPGGWIGLKVGKSDGGATIVARVVATTLAP